MSNGLVYDDASPQSLGGKARAEALSPNRRSSIASEGGKSRANVLSSERKSEIASQGGKARSEGK
jgi:hypothetical protein